MLAGPSNPPANANAAGGGTFQISPCAALESEMRGMGYHDLSAGIGSAR
jgi:hypothetical protein